MSVIGTLMDWILSGVAVIQATTPEIVDASCCGRTDQHLSFLTRDER
jgi:hypothetical protein